MPKHTKAEREKNKKKKSTFSSIFSNLFGGQITFDAEGIPTRRRLRGPGEPPPKKKKKR